MDIFDSLRKDSGIIYPPFSEMYFEKYFYNYMLAHPDIADRYIPIFWTENQISNWDHNMQNQRQNAVNTLDTTKTYFTVVQHDDGITGTTLPKTIVFGMAGVGNIPLPLTYTNPSLFESLRNTPKTIFCSFTGSITHPCRATVCNYLINKPNVVINTHPWTNQISDDKQKTFIDIMSRSRFTLAPRGYGKTSFRMYEALELKSIPVYVYDHPWLPYTELIDWNKMAVLVHVNDIHALYERLLRITDDEVASMLDYYEQHRHLFSYEGMCEYVLNKVKTLL
jgi:hypothetical protein